MAVRLLPVTLVFCLFLGSWTLTCCQVVPYKEKYYDQTIDHFNFERNFPEETYKQRYLVQDKWWNPGKGPIFLYTGNEGPITAFWERAGFLFDSAPGFEALVVFAEHRFYGESLPFGPKKSFQHPYVGVFTVEQALADYATLIEHLRHSLNARTSPVIAFGGSYGGMLSAYLRFKYPNVVAGSIAASAPIFLTSGQSDRLNFFEDVTKVFHDAVPGCEDGIRQAFMEMSDLISQGKTGFSKISKDFNLCDAITGAADVRQLQGWIRNAFTSLTMSNYPYAVGALPAFPVKVSCELLLKETDRLTGLAKITDLSYNTGPKCHDIWYEYVECADPTGCGTKDTSSGWDYQACTEMIMPAGTNNVTDMFPPLSFTLGERTAYCKAKWNVTPRNDWMNINMWGKDIRHSSNIVFSNGDLDPWHRGGVLKDISDTLVAVVIEGGAHHLDLYASNPADPPSVKAARDFELQHIAKWIKEDQCTSQKNNTMGQWN